MLKEALPVGQSATPFNPDPATCISDALLLATGREWQGT